LTAAIHRDRPCPLRLSTPGRDGQPGSAIAAFGDTSAAIIAGL
jgi:hypothetical protein